MFHLKSEVFSKENYKKWLDVDFEDIFPISTLNLPFSQHEIVQSSDFFDETFHSHLCKMRHFGKFSNPFFFIEIDCSFVSCTSFCMSSSCKIGIWPMYGIFFSATMKLVSLRFAKHHLFNWLQLVKLVNQKTENHIGKITQHTSSSKSSKMKVPAKPQNWLSRCT